MASQKVIQSINSFREDILSGKLPLGQLLPTEKQLAESLKLSRPTVAKIYDALRQEGLVRKKAGFGTVVIYGEKAKAPSYGLLFPGAGESEIFGAINDQFLQVEKAGQHKFLWEGTIANDAQVRQETVLEICRYYIAMGIDGVFFAPLERVTEPESINKEICAMFDRNNIPIVLIDRDVDRFPSQNDYPVIGLDNFRAGYLMADHLIGQGCTDLFFLYRKDSAGSVQGRIAGCTSACFDAGLDFTKENLIVGDPSKTDVFKEKKIVPGKTGILCANDATAAALMANTGNFNLKVTKDILVAGFDNMKYAKILNVPLTTYRQPITQIVTTGLQMMDNLLRSKHMVSLKVDLKGELVVRGSTTFS